MSKRSKPQQSSLPLGLEGVRFIEIKESQGSLTIRVEKDVDFGVCPHCGVLTQKVNDRRIHPLIDQPVFEFEVKLEVQKRRWKCINDFCPCQTFTEEVEGLARGCRQTQLFRHYVYQLSRHMTLVGVKRHLAETFHCSVGIATIYRITQNCLVEKIKLPEGVEVAYIGLDEFSKGTGHDYGVCLTDLTEHKVIDTADGGKTKKAAKTVLSVINPSKVKACAMDMWEPFADACREVIPHAAIVIDHYHVVKTVNDALNDVRKRVKRHLKSKAKKEALFKYRKVLSYGGEDLSEKQEARLWEILSWDKQLSRAYELKEVLRSIYVVEDAGQAARELETWLEVAFDSDIPEIVEAAQTLSNWKPEILNFWIHRITNAITEGKINKIKALRRRAFNYNSFQNLRLKILEQEEVVVRSPYPKKRKKKAVKQHPDFWKRYSDDI